MSRLILFNKPFDVLTQFTDGNDRPTLANYIPIKGVYPAGRLDRDSEGLVLLTDDGLLQAHISSPKFKQAKTYWVQVDGEISDEAIAKLSKGIMLKDGPTLAAKARKISEPKLWERDPPVRFRKNVPTSWLELTIIEGRNRQVRRMTAAVGFPTLRLIRHQIGDWSVSGIALGEYKELRVESPASKKANKSSPYKPFKKGKSSYRKEPRNRLK